MEKKNNKSVLKRIVDFVIGSGLLVVLVALAVLSGASTVLGYSNEDGDSIFSGGIVIGIAKAQEEAKEDTIFYRPSEEKTTDEAATEDSSATVTADPTTTTIVPGNSGTTGTSGSSGTTTPTIKDDVNSKQGGDAPSALKDTEKQNWDTATETDKNVYVIYNNQIAVEGNRAYVRIQNPVYSVYNESVKIYAADDNSLVYYVSELMKPGTILEAVKLALIPDKLPKEVILEFTFFNDKGVAIGRKLESATMMEPVPEVEEPVTDDQTMEDTPAVTQ